MDRGLVVVKLPERWLDRKSCRKIVGEVTGINGIYEKLGRGVSVNCRRSGSTIV